MKRSVFVLILSAAVPSSMAATGPDADAFVPASYVRYQTNALPAEKLAEALAGGTNYINGLLDTIEAPLPDPDLWERKAAVLANPSAITPDVNERLVANEKQYSARYFAAGTLKQLVDHGIRFTPEQIDRILKDFDHPDPSVVQGLHDALVQTFGIWFVEGEQWVRKPEEVRIKYKQAWRRFWAQNRERYASNGPLILNDLCLNAAPVRTNDTLCLQVMITNYGTNDWEIVTEAPGAAESRSLRPDAWQDVFTLRLGAQTVRPVVPVAYVFPMTAAGRPIDISALPDRPVHINRATIPAGRQYTYLLNLAEAFPGKDFQQQEVVLSYQMIRKDVPAAVWRGELRSPPVRIE